jgi:predicted nucleotidyltransferase
MLFGIKQKYLADLEKTIASFPEIEKVLVYGSRSRGDFQKTSDLDLAIFGSKLTFDKFLVICTELREVLFPVKLDIVHFENLENQALKQEIEKDGKVLVCKE